MDAGYRGGSHFCVMENTVEILGLRQELPRQPVGQHYQYEHLANREIRSESHARMAVSDINLFFLSSLMDIRADVLRLYLTLQGLRPPRSAERGPATLRCAIILRGWSR